MTEQPNNFAIAIPKDAALPKLYATPEKIDDLLDKIESEARSFAPDLSTTKGRKAIASLAYKVSRSKTALDEAGKALTEEAKAQVKLVDLARKKVRDRLDALRDEVRKPLDEWEAKKAKHDAEVEERLTFLTDQTLTNPAMRPDDISAQIAKVEAVDMSPDFWLEHLPIAEAHRETSLTKMKSDHAAAVQREKDAAELARLRAAEEERQRREAEVKAKAELEARAKAEAERKKREAEEAAEQERLRKEAAAREQERIRKEAEEQAKREAAEAIMKAQREAREAKERAEREAEERIERERQAEARRRKEEQEAQECRRKDAEHLAHIKGAISAALQPIPREDIAQALIDGRVPHVRVLV